jgi:hypothetical protein
MHKMDYLIFHQNFREKEKIKKSVVNTDRRKELLLQTPLCYSAIALLYISVISHQFILNHVSLNNAGLLKLQCYSTIASL